MIREATDDEVRYVLSNLRDKDRDELMSLEWTDSLEDLTENMLGLVGKKWAVLHDDEPVAIFSLVPVAPGVSQAWLAGTNKIGRCGKEIYQAVIAIRDAVFDAGLCHRIQTHSAATHKWSHRWLEKVGLRREGVMRGYGKHGEDFYLYGVIKGDL